MPKPKTGTTINRKGKIYARVQWADETGKRRQKEKRAESKTHADKLIKRMLREIDDHGTRSLEVERMTFQDLAAYYEKHHAVAPKYSNGQKVAGLRSLANVKGIIKTLKNYFGKRKLRSITHGDIEQFKLDRLEVPTKRGTPRSITTVHRDLAILRNMLNVGLREGWLLKNPFHSTKPIINPAFEKKRERILTNDEEDLLLAACQGKRAHLRPIIITALETGMRRGEIITCTWADVDLSNKTITVQSLNSKNQRERTLAISPLLEMELLAIYDSDSCERKDLIFGIRNNFKHAFMSVCRLAGIQGLRFHDLRHTFATRLIEAGIPQAEVSRLLGHMTTGMSDRYVNADVNTARRAVEALSMLRERRITSESSATVN